MKSIEDVDDRKIAINKLMENFKAAAYCYVSGEYIKPATLEQLAASKEAAGSDGGAGVIDIDNSPSYVIEE